MFEIVMPKLGLTMDEGTILQWHKKEGDAVAAGEELAEIETDKSTASVEAPGAGTLYKILYKEAGDVVPVTQPIAYILEAGEQPPASIVPPKAAVEAAAPPKAQQEALTAAAVPLPTAGARRRVSPAARHYAKEHGIDLDAAAADENGTVHLQQVKAAAANPQPKAPKTTPLAKAVADAAGVDLADIPVPEGGRIYRAQVENALTRPGAEPGDRELRLSGMRKTIAKRMTQSKQQVPHFYLSLSADMTNAKHLMENAGYKMSFHDVLMRVLACALKEHPILNAHVSDDAVVLKAQVNVGIAVAVDAGLIVPVVRNVEGKSLREIAAQSAALVAKARDGKLMPDEYQGGTFTISNLGMFGIEQFTAIVNQPEAAILAVGKAVDTPVVIDGTICIRPMVNLSVSFDHRAVDGATGAKFLARVKQLLENPALLI